MNRRNFLKLTAVTAGTMGMPLGAITACTKTGTQNLKGNNVEIIPSICGMCAWKCSVLVHKKNGVVWKIKGNPNCPLASGKVCGKGAGGVGGVYDENRLASPAIRTNSGFKPVEWDEALGFVADKLGDIKKKYGPESLAFFSHGTSGKYFKWLLQGYGTGNIGAPAYGACRAPRDEAYVSTFGVAPMVNGRASIDVENSKTLVLIGTHWGENSHNTQMREFSTAISRGAEIAVVDPRFSVAASKAKWWLPIKPGTDTALLLSWIHVLIYENLYNVEFVNKYCYGFNELAQSVKGYTPAWASSITGIDTKTIVDVVHSLAKHKPNSLLAPGRRSVWYGDDFQRVRANAIINALLGNWGRKGGFFLEVPAEEHFNKYKPEFPTPKYILSKGAYAHNNGLLISDFRKATLTGKPHPVKAWMVLGCNLPLDLPNPQETMDALNKLDLVVVCDTMPSEMAQLADVVIPECHYLERTDTIKKANFRVPFLQLRHKIVEPMGNTKSGFWIVKNLAKKMGLSQYIPFKDEDDYNEHFLKNSGISYSELKNKGVKLLTPSNPAFIEDGAEMDLEEASIPLYNEELKEKGLDPVPVYTVNEEPPPGMYRLLTGRSPVHTFSSTQTNKKLLTPYPENYLYVNINICKSIGIKSGDYVKLTNQDDISSSPIKVYATERIRTDCVYMTHGFGRRDDFNPKGIILKQLKDYGKKGASANSLITKYKADTAMGSLSLNSNFVQIEKVS